MKQSTEPVVRIGMVNFLNTAPLHHKLTETVAQRGWQLVEATPPELNRKLYDGELDLGFISSDEYGLHPELYKILSGLSVTACGPAGSIYLFSHIPIEQLNKVPVLLGSDSGAAVFLAKIVLEKFNGVQPEYSVGLIGEGQHEGFKTVLAVGDDALRLLEEADYLYQYDLGDMWKRRTALPFVSSICAVREEFCSEHPEILSEVHRELLRCRDEGCADLQEICKTYAPRIPFTKTKCNDYLSSIGYNLNAEKRSALDKYFEFLIKRGDIKADAVPIKIFSNLY